MLYIFFRKSKGDYQLLFHILRCTLHAISNSLEAHDLIYRYSPLGNCHKPAPRIAAWPCNRFRDNIGLYLTLSYKERLSSHKTNTGVVELSINLYNSETFLKLKTLPVFFNVVFIFRDKKSECFSVIFFEEIMLK